MTAMSGNPPKQGLITRSLLRAAICAGFGTVAVLGAGCQKTLIRDNEFVTQYDRYDTLRNEREPQYVVDEFGTRRPNLRGRLSPKK